MWRTHSGPSDLQSIDFLILVRGRPGWYLEPAANRGPNVASGSYTVLRTVDRDIEVRVDTSKKLVLFGTQSIDLRQGNVIFVDKVDEPSGPIVANSLFVEAQIPFVRGAEILIPVLKTPEIHSYLRCDARGPRPSYRTLC
jgi:hypothetical protein